MWIGSLVPHSIRVARGFGLGFYLEWTGSIVYECLIPAFWYVGISLFTGEEVSIDKQVACEECPRWLKISEVA